MDRAEETYGLLELVGKRQLFARLQQVAARRTLMGGQWLIHGLADTLVMAASHIPSPPHADSGDTPWVICSEG